MTATELIAVVGAVASGVALVATTIIGGYYKGQIELARAKVEGTAKEAAAATKATESRLEGGNNAFADLRKVDMEQGERIGRNETRIAIIESELAAAKGEMLDLRRITQELTVRVPAHG